MKRILVIDESEVVRETLALILGREFVVVKRPLGKGGLSLTDAGDNVDLLILGMTPAIGPEASGLLRFAARAPFAVLFLVDSKSTARAIEDREQVGCLAKPFNPYELKEKVGRLLARRATLLQTQTPLPEENGQEYARYLEFPYLSRTASSLVHRFAATHLPVLIWGEIGCGQDRVARAIHTARAGAPSRVCVNAAEISADYLAQKGLEASWNRNSEDAGITFLIENLDKLPPSGQSSLLSFLEEEEAKNGRWRLLTTARSDLLEKVYQGELLEALYYKLATLTLRLPPLRERREDVPAIAAWFARFYAKALGLGDASFSDGAIERLGHYLWFGNLSELETVIARTLAVRRKTRIEESDIIFNFTCDEQIPELPEFEEFDSSARKEKETPTFVKTPSAPHNGSSVAPQSVDNHAKSVDLNVLIHELAHELKNPMVTIKTFAQLLGDRYQDENFRARFQDVVGSDIERMDDLLEVMIEFADFSQPRSNKVPLAQRLRTILDELNDECAKRQALVRWKANGPSREIVADEAQLNYILKNIFLAILAQAKIGSEIEIDAERQGAVAISYLPEGARVASITHYFNTSSPKAEDSILPLRILLAKQLVERNGGGLAIEQSNTEREIVKLEFPIA